MALPLVQLASTKIWSSLDVSERAQEKIYEIINRNQVDLHKNIEVSKKGISQLNYTTLHNNITQHSELHSLQQQTCAVQF